MTVDRISLDFFRSYVHGEAEFHPGVNVVAGENAQGKTNLLEAVAYLSSASSHRARYDRELIRHGTDHAFVKGDISARGRRLVLEADLHRGQRRQLRCNGVKLKTAGELCGLLRTVLFCPEDLYLIREGAAVRRRFLDTALCQLRPRYASALASYSRAHEQKTRILRDSEDHPSLLDALPEFSAQMVRFGAVLIHYRCRFIQRLEEYAAVHHRECSGGREELRIAYQTVSAIQDPSADVGKLTDWLEQHMTAHEQAERASRLCLSGPHKDDMLVTIDGVEAKTYSSQGQTRTAALALKLAEREIYRNAAGEYPVLLLDDVLSELDPKRQEFVLNRIAGGQVFITCCEEDRLPSLLGGKVFHVKQGEIL